MNFFLSAAAGLLAADAFCNNHKSTSSRSASMSSSSSSSCLDVSTENRRRRRRQRSNTSPSNSSTSSASTLEASISSLSSSSDEEHTSTDTDSGSTSSDSPSNSDSESTVTTHIRRLRHGRVPSQITRPSQLPSSNTLKTKYISPISPKRRSSDNHSPSESSDSTSETSTNSSSSNADDEEEAAEEVNTSSDSEDSLSSDSSSDTPITPVLNLQRTSAPPTITSSLHSRLQTLIPALRASNAELENERLAGTLHSRSIENLCSPTDNEVDKPVIGMDLGLGVLEPITDAGPGDSTPVRIKRERSMESEGCRIAREEDILGAMMGRNGERGRTLEAKGRKRRKVGIQVVD
ncbi:MAG: hypothetical protein Q9182_004378 [Xanthomendoza sp. 2 TL-2023]